MVQDIKTVGPIRPKLRGPLVKLGSNKFKKNKAQVLLKRGKPHSGRSSIHIGGTFDHSGPRRSRWWLGPPWSEEKSLMPDRALVKRRRLGPPWFEERSCARSGVPIGEATLGHLDPR